MLVTRTQRLLYNFRHLGVVPLGILALVAGERLGLEMPNQPAILLLAVAYCAYHDGLASGLTGAAIHVFYTVFFFSMPGHLFVYDRQSFLRILIWAAIAPAMATMLGRLKRRTDRLLARERASEAALARLNAELEERVALRTAELTLARSQAEQSSRAKSMFLATMSHELRTPLNAIIGFSDIIGREMLGPIGIAKYRGYADDIQCAGRHLLGLINDILDMSKIEASKMALSEEEIDLTVLVEECSKIVAGRAGMGEVRLARHMPPRLPRVRADAMRLKQALLNLLSNAIKFTPPGGRVTIEAGAAAGGGVHVTIADTGIGMAREELAIAMQPFGQIDNRLARRFEGTGLGLPLTKALLELHGATLELESEAGRGTVARVILPASRVLAAPRSGPDCARATPTVKAPDRSIA